MPPPAPTPGEDGGGGDRNSSVGIARARGSRWLRPLAIELIDGYVPRAGDEFTLFHWTMVSGTFSDVSVPEPLVLDASHLYSDGTILVVVPEPATLLLLAVVAVCLLFCGRARRARAGRRAARVLATGLALILLSARPGTTVSGDIELGGLPPALDKLPDPVERLGPKNVVICERLGGLLKHDERKAA